MIQFLANIDELLILIKHLLLIINQFNQNIRSIEIHFHSLSRKLIAIDGKSYLLISVFHSCSAPFHCPYIQSESFTNNFYFNGDFISITLFKSML